LLIFSLKFNLKKGGEHGLFSYANAKKYVSDLRVSAIANRLRIYLTESHFQRIAAEGIAY
jgi:hypothetical protein